MSRLWTQAVAILADLVGGIPMLIIVSFVVTLLFALGWYFWPHWLPWRWKLWGYLAAWGRRSRERKARGEQFRFRLGALRWRLRWRRRRKRRGEASTAEDLPPDVLPDLPAEVLVLTADELAAAGRYKEAVRERLRAIVKDLIERQVIPFRPGWTVTELAGSAVRARPDLEAPMAGAVEVFSLIWYGLQPARAEDDRAMRGHAATITTVLAGSGAERDRTEPVPAGRAS